MGDRSRIWVSLSAALLAGTALGGPLAAAPFKAMDGLKAGSGPLHFVADHEGGEGGEGGEGAEKKAAEGGEGGEGGEGSGNAADAGDTVAYFTQLSLIRGHLFVGMELYRQGEVEHAKTHMKHPQDEIYASLLPAIKARKHDDFGHELDELSELVEDRASLKKAMGEFGEIEDAIDDAWEDSDDVTLGTRLKVVHQLVKTAADEYAEGVKDGAVVNGHEYQDAWGFVQIAKQIVAALPAAERAKAPEAVDTIMAQLTTLDGAWPSVVPPARVATDASVLYGAAARIEIATLSVD
jgi:hypothetical protein